MKLTARIVESMRPSGKRTQVFDQVFDTEQRGLCLRISESGENHFPFAISTAAYETFNI